MQKLTENVFVSGQIRVEDVEALANAGIATIINNRPDGEIGEQPQSVAIENEAKRLGLGYIHLPMAGGVSSELISNSASAYSDSLGPIFAFCGSGTRSTVLWCFANVKLQGVDAVLSVAANAGYNLEQIRGPLTQFVQRD